LLNYRIAHRGGLIPRGLPWHSLSWL